MKKTHKPHISHLNSRRLLALPAGLFLASQTLGATTALAQCSGSYCNDVSTLGQTLLQDRANRAFTSTPTQDEINQRLDQKPASAKGGTVTAPFSASANSVSTSLSDWRSSLSSAERKRLEALKKKDPNLKLPKAAPAPSPVNVWVKTNYQSVDSTGTDPAKSSATTTSAGADYRVKKNALVGGVVQFDNASQDSAAVSDGSVAGQAYMAGPYAAYKLNNNIVVDGKATWGQSNDRASVNGDATDFTTDRSLSQARVSGTWGIDHDKWKLTPSGAVTHVTEDTQGPLVGSAIDNINETRVSVRPELHRPIQTKNGDKIDPYAYVQSSLSLDNANFADAEPQNSIGGGVNITTNRKYSINATADYTAPTGTTADAVAGHIQLNVPLGGSK